jgi:hypothetical protein
MDDPFKAIFPRENDVRGFHYKDGVFFCREGDGSVRIVAGGEVVATVDPHSWASVVACMSRDGEDSASYERARAAQLP